MTRASDRFLRQLGDLEFDNEIANLAKLYQTTSDARWLWRVVILLHEKRRPIPANLVAKLAEWGGKILELSDPRELTAALELTGQPGGTSNVGPKQSAAYERRWRLASEVAAVKRLWPKMETIEACRTVAKNTGTPINYVKSAFYKTFPRRAGGNVAHRDLQGAMMSWR